MTKHILSFLDEVEMEQLVWLASADFSGFNNNVDRKQIYDVLFATRGFELLFSADARRVLLQSLPIGKLEEIARNLGTPAGRGPLDLAISISNLRWTTGSPLAKIIRKSFSVPLDFLPALIPKEPATEVLTPFERPPPLFRFQEVVVDKLVEFLSGAGLEKRALVQLPTGAGKTRVAVTSIIRSFDQLCAFGREPTILWITHSEELANQTTETIRRLWLSEGSTALTIAKYWGGARIDLDDLKGCFVIATQQKLVGLLRKSEETLLDFSKETTVVFFDEAHRAGGRQIQRVLSRFPKDCLLIGITATPGRSSKDERQNTALARMFQGNLISDPGLGVDPVATLQSKGVLARIHRRELEGTTLSIDSAIEEITPPLLKRLASDEGRNQRIVDEVVDLAREERTSVVFCCTLQNARDLASRAALRGVRSAYIDGTMSRRRRGKLVNAFRAGELDVVFNFGVLSTGFDAPNISAVIIARPTSSIVLYSQMIGRGLRGPLVGGTPDFELVDVKDNIGRFSGLGDIYFHFENYWK